MKISVITACYNSEKTIEDTIKSVFSQSFDNIEYIIIDGNSKDNTLSIIESYKDKISVIVSEPDKGMYEAINKGLRRATGDIVGLLHADDTFYDSDVLTNIAAFFEREEPQMMYGNGIFVDFEQNDKIVRDWKSGVYKKSKVKRGWLPLHPTVYLKREVLDLTGLYDESYKIAADTEFLVRILYDYELKVRYNDTYIVRMKMGGLSTNSNTLKTKWKEDLRLYREHGFNAIFALTCKVFSKVPQFISAKFNKRR